MNKTDKQAFVLWGNGFDAPVATIFASRLRQLGVSVTIVGIQGATGADANGIRLHADTTLGEVLIRSHHALAVIIPCTASRLQKAENDPRIFRFFQQTIAPTTLVVVRSLDVLMQVSLLQIAREDQYVLYECVNEQLAMVEEVTRRITV